MREFRMDRITRIVSEDAPVRLLDNCCLVIHVVPFSSFDLQAPFMLEQAITKALNFPPIMRHYPERNRMNFDGLLTLSNADARADKEGAYIQVFRSGAVEAVWSSIASAGYVDIRTIDVCIVHYTRVYAMALRECGAEPPFAIMASLIGMMGKGLTTGRQTSRGWEGEYADRDQLHLTEVIFEDVPLGDPECAAVLRPALDQLANAAGLAVSPSFDSNGKYQQRFRSERAPRR